MLIKAKFWAIACAGFYLMLPVPTYSQGDTATVSLFNGTDITGWSLKAASNDLKNFVTVQNGYISIESSGGNGWLWLESDSVYSDFVLKLKFSVPSGDFGNSGVNFRSFFDVNDAGGYLNGPQVDIDPKSNWRTGLILDMTKGNERWLKPDLKDWNITQQPTPTGWKFNYDPEWNTLEIRVIGMKVTTFVNGIVSVDQWDGTGILNDALHNSKKVGEVGSIALQAHSSQKVKIFFKDIFIQDLTRIPVSISRPRHKVIATDTENQVDKRFSLDGKKVNLKADRVNSNRTRANVLKMDSESTR
jgi:hypothetical protein